jgi:hypothetical protein
MSSLDLLGYLGGLLIFSTFYLKTMLRLRMVAIASNVLYISYGALGHMWPILILHLLLLPLNIWRLSEFSRVVGKLRASSEDSATVRELIVPHLRIIKRHQGEQLFAAGNFADSIYYVFKGSLRLLQTNVVVAPGELAGLADLFFADQRRTDTAICSTEVKLGVVSKQKVFELFYKNPDFAELLARMLVQRALADHSRTANAFSRQRRCIGGQHRVRHPVLRRLEVGSSLLSTYPCNEISHWQ